MISCTTPAAASPVFICGGPLTESRRSASRAAFSPGSTCLIAMLSIFVSQLGKHRRSGARPAVIGVARQPLGGAGVLGAGRPVLRVVGERPPAQRAFLGRQLYPERRAPGLLELVPARPLL